MKKSIIIIFTIVMIIAMSGCEQNDNLEDQTPIESKYSIDDFYNEIVVIEERLDELTEGEEVEASRSFFDYNLSLVSGTKKLTRDELYNNREESDIVSEDYLEQLINTRMYIEGIRNIIENAEEDIKLGVRFEIETEDLGQFVGVEQGEYKFVLAEEGYVLIESLNEYGTHQYLKTGLQDDILECSSLHYAYNGGSSKPSDNPEMHFNYFTFTEGEDATYINYLGDNSSLSYTSIEENRQFTISSGAGMVEGPTPLDGYNLSVYDSETNVRTLIEVAEGVVVGEYYLVLDDLGSVFTYDGASYLEGAIKLQVNALNATGWDYAIVPEGGVNDEINEVIGLYDNEDNQLYNGRVNYNDSPGNGFMGIWLEFTAYEEINDEVFSLNMFGIDLDHPKANKAFLDQIRIHDIQGMKDATKIEGLNFFASDLHDELYGYIDQDIRNDLEGVVSDPIITEGDVEEFERAMTMFNENLEQDQKFELSSNTTMEIKDGASLLSSSTTRMTIAYDLEQRYFRFNTITDDAYNDQYTYYLYNNEHGLLEYEIENRMGSIDVVDKDSSEETFLNAVSDFIGDNSATDGVKKITKHSDTEFELVVTSQYFNTGGVDVVKLYEQAGIKGFEDQEVTILIEFNKDFTAYEISYAIDGLETTGEEAYEVSIESTQTMEIVDTINYIDPNELSGVYWYFSQSKDGITTFITLEAYNQTGYFNRGVNWFGIDATKLGDYKVTIGNNSSLEFTVYDKDGNTVELLGNTFTSTYIGKYYIEYYADYSESGNISVLYSETPKHIVITLDNNGGVENINYVPDGNNHFRIIVPESDQDRILRFESEILGDHEYIHYYIYDPHASEEGHIYNEEAFNLDDRYIDDACIFYIPKGETYKFWTGGSEEPFEFKLTYTFIKMNDEFQRDPITLSDYTEEFFTWYNEDSLESFVYFTVDEDGQYVLDMTYNQFGRGYVNAEVYTLEGTMINDEWISSINLTAGDYYIRFTFDVRGGYDPFKAIIYGDIWKLDI